MNIEKATIHSLIKTTLQDIGIQLDAPLTHYIAPHAIDTGFFKRLSLISNDNQWLITGGGEHLLFKYISTGQTLQTVYFPIQSSGQTPNINCCLHQSDNLVLTAHWITKRDEYLPVPIYSNRYVFLRTTDISTGKEIWRSERIPGFWHFYQPYFTDEVAMHNPGDNEIAWFNYKQRRMVKKIKLPAEAKLISIGKNKEVYILSKDLIMYYLSDKTLSKIPEGDYKINHHSASKLFSKLYHLHADSISDRTQFFITKDSLLLIICEHRKKSFEIRNGQTGDLVKAFNFEVRGIFDSNIEGFIFLSTIGAVLKMDLSTFEIADKYELLQDIYATEIIESPNGKFLYLELSSSSYQGQGSFIYYIETRELIKERPDEQAKKSMEYAFCVMDGEPILCSITKEKYPNRASGLNLKSGEIAWLRANKDKKYELITDLNLFKEVDNERNESIFDYNNKHVFNKKIDNFARKTYLGNNWYLQVKEEKYTSQKRLIIEHFTFDESQKIELNFNDSYSSGNTNTELFLIENIGKSYEPKGLLKIYDISDHRYCKHLNQIELPFTNGNFVHSDLYTLLQAEKAGLVYFYFISHLTGELVLQFVNSCYSVHSFSFDWNEKILVYHDSGKSIVFVDLNTGQIIHEKPIDFIVISNLRILNKQNILFTADGSICTYDLSAQKLDHLCLDFYRLITIDESRIYYVNKSGSCTIYHLEKRIELGTVFLHGADFLITAPSDPVSETGWFYTNNTDLITVAKKDKTGKIIKILDTGDPEREVYIAAHNRKDIVLALLNDDSEAYKQLVQPIINNQLKLEFERKDKMLILNQKNDENI